MDDVAHDPITQIDGGYQSLAGPQSAMVARRV